MNTSAGIKLFGTDGIRGQADRPPLDSDTVKAIGQALAGVLGAPLVVGTDPRESSPRILRSLRIGIESAGGRVLDLGVLPTPAVALLTRCTGASGGVMISASHNPFEDNGIKVFGPDGQKLTDEGEARLEERVADIQAGRRPECEDRSGVETLTPPPDVDLYLRLLRKGFPDGAWLGGLRIACDLANGATSGVAVPLFESLGATVDAIHSCPDGRNINEQCGAVHPESLIEHVRTHRVDLGVAYDGDGDRSIFVSGDGRLIDGDGVLLVMARRLMAQGQLVPAAVVGTSMTNIALEQKLRGAGIRLDRVDVGDRYILRKMLDDGIRLGGEPSGHVIFGDYGLSGDGLLTTLKICQAMVERSASLDELTRDWQPAPQLIRNVRVPDKPPLANLPDIGSKISEIQALLETRGRIVVRYSGTEAVLRIMIESDSATTNEALATELEHIVLAAME